MVIRLLVESPREMLKSFRASVLSALYNERRALYKSKYKSLENEFDMAKRSGVIKFTSVKDFILGHYSHEGFPDMKPDKEFEERYCLWRSLKKKS